MPIKTRSSKRGRWIEVSLFIAIILLGSLTALLFWLSSLTSPGFVDASKLDETKVNINESESIYPGIRIITETSNDKYFPYTIQYPQSNVLSFNENVKAYTQKLKTIYLEEKKYINKKDKNVKNEFNVSFDVYQNANEYYSFVIQSNMIISESDDFSETKIFHLHAQSGHMLTIKDILAANESSLTILAAKVKDSITSDKKLNSFLLPKQFEEKTSPKWENFSNFALKEDFIEFYYNKNEITSSAAGTPVITIPLSDINSILADEFKDPSISEETSPKKKVALTFDDGPNPETTRKILNTLEKYNAKATFFMIGSRVASYPEIVKDMKEAGHELGNHTWNHIDLTKSSTKEIASEINNTSNAIELASGKKPTVFRPPYGAVNDSLRSQSTMPVVLWDVDTLDWKHRDSAHLLAHVKENVKDGSTVLMHDIHASTANGLDAVLAYLQEEGFSFVTVSELNT